MTRKRRPLRPKNSKALPTPRNSYSSLAALILTPPRRMTREEREEAYNRARERIFGSSEKNGDASQGNFSSTCLRQCRR